MGAQRQHLTAVPANEGGSGCLQGLRLAQGHQHTLTTGQPAERSVVDPVHIDPEAVDHRPGIRATDRDADPGAGAAMPFDDVGSPVAIGPRFLIGMVGLDPGCHLQGGGIGLSEQHRVDPQLRNEHLHAPMGIADIQPPRHLERVAVSLDTPVAWTEHQRRSGTQPMPQLKPGDAESEGQRSDQHRHGVVEDWAQRRGGSAQRI